MIQQREVVEAEHVHQQRRRLLLFRQFEPTVEGLLRPSSRAVDAGNAVIEQRRVVALGDEGNLVAEVGQPVVDGVADSISTRVLTPSRMIRRIKRS